VPELPEVETIRRQLAPVTEGRTITAVRVSDPRWCQPLTVDEMSARLRGRRIDSFERRGKFMVLRLDDGVLLVMHLRMTGNLLYVPVGLRVPRGHLRASLELDDGAHLAFVDPRRFGTAAIHPDQDSLDRYFAGRVGIEPLESQFTPELLFDASRGRRTPVKAFLLDQRKVAGIGNIYADEALHRAAISPRMRTARMSRAQAKALHDAIREALRDGIDAKGASIDDFRDAYGVRGSFQDRFLVHRREGLPCPGCGAPVKKIRVAGRGTYYCPACQRS
jgi:formamidopyrimidine-DNA glycosylase